jgi:dolichyl-phosphate-mannose-protein mannosyltransferase
MRLFKCLFVHNDLSYPGSGRPSGSETRAFRAHYDVESDQRPGRKTPLAFRLSSPSVVSKLLGPASRPWILLAALTLACLLPFSGKAFNVDDPLFVWSARQIAVHPLDPYGIRVIWDATAAPLSEVTKNPPLACYYAAAVGSIAGWSERALHVGFLLPAVGMVLGTYRLAQRFTPSPLVAATATLFTPAVLVSATSVMCDILMLAFWVWAIALWLEGFELDDRRRLLASALLMSAAALTKYFGVCLIPLLLAYSIHRQRRIAGWAWYFTIPILSVAAYQLWTSSLYGRAMFFDAFTFARDVHWSSGPASILVNALVGGAFVGGCTLSALALAPLVWSWKWIPLGLTAGAIAGFAIASGRWALGESPLSQLVQAAIGTSGPGAGAQLSLFIAGGIAVLSLAGAEVWKRRNPDATILALWVLGTFFFAAFVNWSVNARSVLPLVPAAGILLARRLEDPGNAPRSRSQGKLVAALVASGLVSVWVAAADAEWADSEREAARLVKERLSSETAAVWFEGHWGFQYYAQKAGLRPFDLEKYTLSPGDVLIMPEGNIQTRTPPQKLVRDQRLLEIDLHQPISTMRWRMGAGFYSSFFGPLPFAFGAVSPERYFLFRIDATLRPGQWP